MVEIIDELELRNRLYVFEDRFQAGELLVARAGMHKPEPDLHLGRLRARL